MRRKGEVGERVRLYRDSAGNTRVFSLDPELGTIDGADQRSTAKRNGNCWASVRRSDGNWLGTDTIMMNLNSWPHVLREKGRNVSVG